jgi:TRAP-type C4-dicarboxylate transport system permease small subunit
MRKWLDRLYSAAGALAAISLAGIAVLMLVQVIGRELGLQLRGADDMAAWLCAASAFLGLGHTFRNGEMVRVGLWLGMLKGRRRWLAEVSALSVTTVFLAYAAWAVSSFVWESWRMNEINQGLLQIPVWIPQMSLVLGMVILLIAVLDEFSRVLRGKKPAYQLAEEARNARGDFSEAM